MNLQELKNLSKGRKVKFKNLTIKRISGNDRLRIFELCVPWLDMVGTSKIAWDDRYKVWLWEVEDFDPGKANYWEEVGADAEMLEMLQSECIDEAPEG